MKKIENFLTKVITHTIHIRSTIQHTIDEARDPPRCTYHQLKNTRPLHIHTYECV